MPGLIEADPAACELCAQLARCQGQTLGECRVPAGALSSCERRNSAAARQLDSTKNGLQSAVLGDFGRIGTSSARCAAHPHAMSSTLRAEKAAPIRTHGDPHRLHWLLHPMSEDLAAERAKINGSSCSSPLAPSQAVHRVHKAIAAPGQVA